MSGRIFWVPARRILSLHELRRWDHFHELVRRMRKHGWQGRPIPVELVAGNRPREIYGMGWTSVHRLAAARALNIRVPVVFINGGKTTRGKPLAARTTTDPSRYKFLRRRRDPASLLLAAEIKINDVSDRAGVL